MVKLYYQSKIYTWPQSTIVLVRNIWHATCQLHKITSHIWS